MNFKTIAVLLSLLFISSCVSRKSSKESELNILQNIDQITKEASLNSQAHSTIQPGDQLIINVTAKDMAVVSMFNRNYVATDLVQENASTNVPTRGQAAVSGPSYIVDGAGDITFPLLGNINTNNKTIAQLKSELTQKVSAYVINPNISVRLANFRVTVLGEVTKQGEYTVVNGEGTILNAIGLAGGLTVYGDRSNVLLIRNVDGVLSKEKINLKDASFFESPYYLLRQGDVIYIPSNQTQEKIAKLNPNTPLYISAAGIVVTILALIFR